MLTRTNKLLRLVEQFEALPKQKELRQAKFQLATIADQVAQNTSDVKQTVGRLNVLRDVHSQPQLLVDEVKPLLKALLSTAQLLDVLVRSGEGQATRITGALDTLAKSSRAMSEKVGAAWTFADNDVTASTEALIDLTSTYDPIAQRKLQQALDRFKKVRAPSDQSAVLLYREAREALMSVRLSLNIPGVVGQFLGDALRGVGSVQALADPQVQSFLSRHPQLQTRLTVKLS